MNWNALKSNEQGALADILASSCTLSDIDLAISGSFEAGKTLSALTSKHSKEPPGKRFRSRLLDIIQLAVSKARLESFVDEIQQIKLGYITFRNLADLVEVRASKVSVSGVPGFEFQGAANQLGIVDFEAFIERLAEIKEATCRIVLPDGKSGKVQSLGTGILVGNDLVLTNYHVVQDLIGTDFNSKIKALSSTLCCQFDYTNSKAEGVSAPVATGEDWVAGLSTIDAGAAAGGQNPASNAHLDYALIRLAKPAPPVAGKTREFETPSSANAFVDGLPVLVTHYPGQEPLSASFGKTVMTQANGTSLRYDADLAKGSSGSGVYLLPACSLVSLHQGADLAAGYNQGIPIGRILEDHLRNTKGVAL